MWRLRKTPWKVYYFYIFKMMNPHPPRNIAPLSSIKRPSPSSISLPPKSPPNPTRISIPITCMTSASELFQSLRSRNGGRNPLSNPTPAPIRSDFRHRRHHRRNGLDLNSHEDRNTLRRPRSIPRNDSPAVSTWRLFQFPFATCLIP